MDRNDLREGKDRVLRHLIRPLDEVLGLKRPRKCKTQMEHVAQLAELQARLAYLGEPELVALREAIIEEIPHGAQWPAPIVVLQMARMLRLPPPSDSPMVTSVMASALGQRAHAQGWHVELWRWMKANGRVPKGEAHERQLRQQAEEGQRSRDRLVRLRDRGQTLSSVEVAMLDAYARDNDRATGLVLQGAGEPGEVAA